ncbi:MAG: pyrimidine 5'-nucleotidase [Beijerinckiaceae bacterium]|jgi:putative hydrolase of the HAD superfamily|nr:pyrimidine 5'-nucleotidase [Beijerinckiaceae bacterium]
MDHPVQAIARFEGIDTWIFDLDNTLYPPHADLWPKVDQKITQYISDLLGVDGLTARAIQKYYYQTHGTTLNGLMKEHAIDPHAFLDFVHDIDRSSLPPDARLAEAIGLLPGRRFIFTNGSRRHAEATIDQLGIAGLFDDVFDIVESDFVPKPARQPYEKFLARHGIAPVRAAMFEDIPRNLEIPAELGMRTVLVVPDSRGDHKDEWERFITEGPGAIGIRFDAVTPDLPEFLTHLVRELGRSGP